MYHSILYSTWLIKYQQTCVIEPYISRWVTAILARARSKGYVRDCAVTPAKDPAKKRIGVEDLNDLNKSVYYNHAKYIAIRTLLGGQCQESVSTVRVLWIE